MDNKTPIQIAIAHFKDSHNEWAASQITDYLKSLLPKEKEFVEKVFEAGAYWATEVLDSYVKRPKEPDINQLINQLYPKP